MSSRSLRASVSGATAQDQQPVKKRSSAGKSSSSSVTDGTAGETTSDRLPNKKMVHRNSTMGLLGLFGRKHSKAEKQQQQPDRSLRSSPSFFTNPGDLAHYVPFYDPLLYSNHDETDNSISSSRSSINSLGKNRTPSGKSFKSGNNSAFLNPLASLVQLPLAASKPTVVLLIADQLSMAGEVNGTGELESEAYRPYYDDDDVDGESDYELGPLEATDNEEEDCHNKEADCCHGKSESENSDHEPPPNPPMLNRQHCFRRKFHNNRTRSCHNFGQVNNPQFAGDNQRRRTVNERLLMMRRIVSTPPESDRETEEDVDVASVGSTDFLLFDDIVVFRPHQQSPADPCHIHPHLSQ